MIRSVLPVRSLFRAAAGACAWACLLTFACGEPQRVYRIGNSFTWDSRPPFMDELSSSTSVETYSGYHIKCSSTLAEIAGSRSTCTDPTDEGVWQDALGGFEWDNLIVQPFRGSDSTLSTDIASIETFWLELLSNTGNANSKFAIYQSWPFRSGTELWENWLGPADDVTRHRQAYYESLRDELALSGIEADIIPNADVLYHILQNLDEFDAVSSITDLYRDQIHMSALGQFIVGTTVLTFLNGEDLTGIPTGSYSSSLSDLERDQLQTAIWKIVNAVQNPGDLNADGTVDIQDYADWSAGYGGSAAGLDANLDGVVDAGDYSIWRDAYANAAITVPEPSAVATVLCFVLLGGPATRRSPDRRCG